MNWRDINCDYRLSLWQGKLPLNKDKDAQKLLKRAESFLNKTPLQQRIHFIKESCCNQMGTIRSRRGAITLNCRRFLMAQNEAEIIAAYENLSAEEKSYVGVATAENSELLELHKIITENQQVNEYARLAVHDDQIFLKKWQELKKQAQKNSAKIEHL